MNNICKVKENKGVVREQYKLNLEIQNETRLPWGQKV